MLYFSLPLKAQTGSSFPVVDRGSLLVIPVITFRDHHQIVDYWRKLFLDYTFFMGVFLSRIGRRHHSRLYQDP